MHTSPTFARTTRDPASYLPPGSRHYDPQVGQFISEDPIGFDAGDMNLKRYVGNNPTNMVDPTGLAAFSLDNGTNGITRLDAVRSDPDGRGLTYVMPDDGHAYFAIQVTRGGHIDPTAFAEWQKLNLGEHKVFLDGRNKIELNPGNFNAHFRQGKDGAWWNYSNGDAGATVAIRGEIALPVGAADPILFHAHRTGEWGVFDILDAARDGFSFVDAAQAGLDLAGLIPLLGAAPDLINAGISAAKGNTGQALLSLAAAIPLFGQLSTGAKWSGRLADAATTASSRSGKNIDSIELARHLDTLAQQAITPRRMEIVDTLRLFNRGERAADFADPALINKLRARGYEIDQSTDIQKYLDARGANAATFMQKDLLLRPDPRRIEVLEEYLHNVQNRIGLTNKMTPAQLEIHVKEFMVRHRRLLELSDSDIMWLATWLKHAK